MDLNKAKELEEKTLAVMTEFKNMNLWQGKIRERKEKLAWLNGKFNEIFTKNIILNFDIPTHFSEWGSSGGSDYNLTTNTITLRGRISLITFLHEYAHALGLNDLLAQEFATSLFKKVFPEKWTTLQVRNPNNNNVMPFINPTLSPNERIVGLMINPNRRQ
jgi:hypothetical protein